MPRDQLPPPLTDDDELLYRQVHPKDCLDGRVASSAFNPSKEHDYELSVAREMKTTPEGAYLHHTGEVEACLEWDVGCLRGAGARRAAVVVS